jgi:protein-S-isoprenylcysteine O-methyltransferase Ste14
MGVLLGTFVIFLAVAVLLVNAADREQDAPGIITIGVFFAYLLHADTVVTAAYLDTGRLPLPREPMLVLGVVVMAVGAILFFWSTRVLVRHGHFRGVISERLVDVGPYAWMRHPQDTGWGLVLLGVALAGRNVIALALVAIFVLFVQQLARADERLLEKRFGPRFRAYRESTPAVGLRRAAAVGGART